MRCRLLEGRMFTRQDRTVLLGLRQALDVIQLKLDSILQKEEFLMATLDDVLAGVAAESTKEDSLIALTTGIKAQLDAILAGNLTPAQQAKVDALFQGVTDNATKVQAAIDANTTPTPPPPAP